MWSLTVDVWCNCVHHISHTDHHLGASFISETPGLRIDFRLVWKIHSTFALNAPLVTPLWVWLNLEKMYLQCSTSQILERNSSKFFWNNNNKIYTPQCHQQNVVVYRYYVKTFLTFMCRIFFSVYFLCPNPNKIYTFDWKLNTKNVFLLIIVYSYKTVFITDRKHLYLYIVMTVCEMSRVWGQRSREGNTSLWFFLILVIIFLFEIYFILTNILNI